MRGKRLILTNGEFTILDLNDYHKYKNINWRKDRYGYVITQIQRGDKTKTIYLHRLINNTPADKITDHINCNKLDNRRANLRSCTYAENLRNRPKRKHNTSGYKGVSRYIRKYQTREFWRARITYNRKEYILGYFRTPEEAHEAYKTAAKAKHGDFAHV